MNTISQSTSLRPVSAGAVAILASMLAAGCSAGPGSTTSESGGPVAESLGRTQQRLQTADAGGAPAPEVEVVRFDLKPNPKFAPCLAQYPDDPARAPVVHAQVVRGSLNDVMTLRGQYIKPGLAFDLFTVEHSALAADGTPDPAFTNFGMAWYQSDLEADDNGRARVSIQTILLDQIFGFDPAVALPPTNTFEVGFWFNDPQDAAACGFDTTKPTPFNGEHQAGPLAMISLPDATTGLGPLCTKPDTSVSPARCSP